ncbi:MAG: flavodoxin [Bacteroidales bacterium]|jgi:flavodoxin|nr:flavodoxin [Bacteroidales bacterium]
MKAKSLLIILLSVLLLACNNTKKDTGAIRIEKVPEPKILIAYYSLTGNTREVAEQIHDKFGGDIFEIELLTPYPTDEKTVIDIVKVEMESDYLPEVQNKVENMDEYDIVFLGTPIWFGTAATPIFTFVKEYDFSGKKVIPFFTCGGGDEGSYVEDVKVFCEGAEIYEAFGNRRPDREEGTHVEKVQKYLDQLVFNN